MKQIIFFQFFSRCSTYRYAEICKKKRVDFDHGLPLKKIKAYTNNKGYFIVIYFSFTRFTIIVRNANYTYVYMAMLNIVYVKRRGLPNFNLCPIILMNSQ